MRNLIRLAIAILVVPLLWFGLVGGCLYLGSLDRKNVYETPNAQGQKKDWFVEASMPGVSPDEVLSLSYIRTGGREPPYIAVMELSTNGLSQLRSNTEHSGSGTFAEPGVMHLWGGQPEIIHSLGRHAPWWTMKESDAFETRYVHWKGDHASKFFIPTTGGVIYVEAVIH